MATKTELEQRVRELEMEVAILKARLVAIKMAPPDPWQPQPYTPSWRRRYWPEYYYSHTYLISASNITAGE